MKLNNGIRIALGALFLSPAIVCNPAVAEDSKPISIFEHKWDFYSDSQYKAAMFEQHHAEDGTPRAQLKSIEDPELYEREQKSETYQFVTDKKIQDEILDKIPFGDDLKSVWYFVDGDTDILFTGLRVNRRNKGLSFTTNELPIFGKMNDIELEFKAGEDNEVELTTHTIPFMGRLDGFVLKATAGDDDNRIFARYTVPFKYD